MEGNNKRYYSPAELLQELEIPLYERTILLNENDSREKKKFALIELLAKKESIVQRAEKKRKIDHEKDISRTLLWLDSKQKIEFQEKCIDEYVIKNNAEKLFTGNIKDIQDFIYKLQPIHSCSVETFKKILSDGFLRSSFDLRKGGKSDTDFEEHSNLWEIPSQILSKKILDFLKQTPFKLCRIDNKTPLMDCNRCINPIMQWAAVLLSEKRLGDILVIRIRKHNLWSRISDLFDKKDFQEVEKLVNEEFERRVKSGEIFGEIGINFWVDKYLGSDKRVFSVLGPNADYGPVSIMLKKELLSDTQTEVLINSSATFISGTSFELRPWAGKFFSLFVKLNEEQEHTQIFQNTIEVMGQARIACSNSPIFRENISSGDLPEGMISASYKKNLPLKEIGTNEIIDWYLNVDSHGRIEGLLPSTVPINLIDRIFLTQSAFTLEMKKLLSSIRIPEGTLLERTIVAKNEEEILKIQKLFSHWKNEVREVGKCPFDSFFH